MSSPTSTASTPTAESRLSITIRLATQNQATATNPPKSSASFTKAPRTPRRCRTRRARLTPPDGGIRTQPMR